MSQFIHSRAIFLPLILLFLLFSGCDESNITEADRPGATEITSPADGTLAKRGGVSESRGHIVVFTDDVGDPAAEAEAFTRRHGGSVGFVYSNALKGYSVQGLPEQALEAISRSPRVAYVETDDRVSLFAQEVPTGVQRIFAEGNDILDIDGVDDARVDVDVAIIDTGIDFEHPDLNVSGGVDCTLSGGGPPWSRQSYCSSTEGTGGDDDHYHGTHVAGTVAARDNGIGVVGVAPGARLWAVKVLDSAGSGYESGIVAGIDWIAKHGGIEVANMSLGGSGYSQAEYDAIQNAVNTGVAFAVAAGNDNDYASNYSPAAFDNVLTVSALADFDGLAGGNGSPTCRTDQDDTLADFSNWGDAVQIAAPGVCILSTFPIEQGEYGTISGTSMASPHAAGALALLASSNNPGNATDVYNLYGQVIGAGNFDWTDDSGDGILEPLLDVSKTTLFNPAMIGDGGGTTNSPPTASFTDSCSDLSCTFDGSGSSDSDGLISDYSWDFGDGATSSVSSVSHTYAADGTYSVQLTVTDDQGATDTETRSVTVSSVTTNSPPTASFTDSCSDLSCTFDGSGSSDSDGSISTYSWDFGDGATGSVSSVSHTYASDGTYTVQLTVTDDQGATDVESRSVTVSSASTGFSLSATGRKVKGRKHVDLTWSGATSTNVDVYRDGAVMLTTANDGAYTDATGEVGGGSYTYQVCESGTSTCSNEVTVIF